MSDEPTVGRRTVIRGIGAVAATAGVAGVRSAATDSPWTVAKAETDSTLYDVEDTSAGPYAVGTGGVVIDREGDVWEKILDGGPSGNGNDLYGAAVTDDGKRLWFVGSSGAVGEYDVETGSLNDHSAPMDVTNNFNDVAVTGPAGEANVYVAGDSGKVYYSFENGETGTWNYVTPGSGAALPAIDFYDDRAGHLVDTNGKVFATDDGETWNPIGIGDANVNFYGVDSDGANDVTVSGGGGMIFRYDGAQWTPTDLGDTDLKDVTYDDGDGFTVGGGGTVYNADAGSWDREDTPTGQNLNGIVVADVGAIAVGAGGTVIER
jgi:photosystem II stability/assembly factor-like uncharacterized protein